VTNLWVFKAAPMPIPGQRVDLVAARALHEWITHPDFCGGGTLSARYIPPYLAALIAEVEQLRDDEGKAAVKQPKFASGDAVTVLKPQAVLAPPFTRLPGTVVRVGSFDAFANAWDYLVKTEQGEIWGTCNTVRPSPRTEGPADA
jgi:hypothetical protein